MKRRLRAKVWWPGIDRQVENFVKRCRDYLLDSQPNKPPPMTRHKFPIEPWQCVGIDLLDQEQVLVIIDYFSRYQEIKFIRSITSSTIIAQLKETTGKTPTELMYKRNIREKIPSLNDIGHEQMDEEAADMDLINKQKGKVREYRVRNAKEDDIRVGDKVLLQNVIFPHKLTTNFGNTEYELIQRNGNEVTVVDKEGKTVKRNISHLKKIPTPMDVETMGTNDNVQENISEANTPTTNQLTPASLAAETTPQSRSESTTPGSTLLSDEPASSNPKIPPLKLKRKKGMWRPE